MEQKPTPSSEPGVKLQIIGAIIIVLLIVWAAGQYTPAYPRQLPAQQSRAICVVDSDGVCR